MTESQIITSMPSIIPPHLSNPKKFKPIDANSSTNIVNFLKVKAQRQTSLTLSESASNSSCSTANTDSLQSLQIRKVASLDSSSSTTSIQKLSAQFSDPVECLMTSPAFLGRRSSKTLSQEEVKPAKATSNDAFLNLVFLLIFAIFAVSARAMVASL